MCLVGMLMDPEEVRGVKEGKDPDPDELELTCSRGGGTLKLPDAKVPPCFLWLPFSRNPWRTFMSEAEQESLGDDVDESVRVEREKGLFCLSLSGSNPLVANVILCWPIFLSIFFVFVRFLGDLEEIIALENVEWRVEEKGFNGF